MSINGLSVAQQRAALRRLVVVFGELNAIVELATSEASPELRVRAEAARDLLGELVAEVAVPGRDRTCAAAAVDPPSIASRARYRVGRYTRPMLRSLQ
ncbi:hypothetical protein [Nocardia spumae]|uniref:hypothetical protein n=1 Tax=Nocardia spumae TaxID=2887190 RepID=UPI001D143A4E|nr:hypothetical protein [Nocardia spumae]